MQSASGMPMQPLPVRTHLTIMREAVARACTVFCESQQCSVSLASCGVCVSSGAVTRDANGQPTHVECSRFTLPSVPPPPESGTRLRASAHPGAIADAVSRLPVGLALTREVTTLRYDVSIAAAARVLANQATAFGLPVVDERGRFLGLLTRAATLLALDSASEVGVAERMTLTACIEESATLDEAFAAMTRRRLREITVVDADRVVVGTLRDVDALRFVAYVSRTGLRPSFAA